MSEQLEDVGHGVHAMAFWHQDGLESRRDLARAFGGPDGRIATVLDLIDARLATKNDEYPWSNAFVSETRVYVGFDLYGRPQAIVTQGTGPKPVPIDSLKHMSTGSWGASRRLTKGFPRAVARTSRARPDDHRPRGLRRACRGGALWEV